MADLFGDHLPEDALDHLEDPEVRARWPAALAEMIDVIDAAHRHAGDDADVAREHAVRAVRAVAHHLGGRMTYLPKGERLEQALRDREIWARFTGRNVPELARRYQVTEIRIYEILREQRAIERARRQHDMFAGDATG